jgi:hypothetical protein
MRRNKKIRPIAIAASIAFSATAAMAATTPYDLIRPTWPLNWDSTVFENFDTTVAKKIGVLDIPATPESFKAGALMPDTLDQAYFDAINTKISPIRVNQAGYLKSDKERQFYYVGSKATEFEVVDVDGKSLSTKVTGTFTATETETASDWTISAGTDVTTNAMQRYIVKITGPSGKVFVGNIPQSVPTDKRLRIKVGDEISSTFIVSDDVYTMAKDAALKFLGIQRSGNSESWFHGPSHVKDGAGKVLDGKDEVTDITAKAGDLQGGWYDCGDHLKESQTQAFTFMALAVMSATNPAKDVDHYAYNHGEFVKTDGIPDVLREAKHGADFFLRAFRVAKGVVDDMPVSIGNFGSDHGWWGRPEIQDYVNASNRGGYDERDIRLGELGSNISGMIAAGLAILSKDYAQYDKAFADSCLMVAEKMYDFAKNLKLKDKNLGTGTYDGGKPYKYNRIADGWSTPAYNGNNDSHDDLALAAIALHYATYEKTGKMDYLNDAVEDTEIGVAQEGFAGFFHGGWMAWSRDGMRKSTKNTGWANAHTYALYGFYKMLLKDAETGLKYGIDNETRLAYAENVALALGTNVTYMSANGTQSISIPNLVAGGAGEPLYYGDLWYTMMTDQTWIYNRYQMGNIFEVLAYADVTKDLDGVELPQTGAHNWNAEAMKKLGINQLNYMFGVNPWDVSFVYGVGDKNDAHPHHRASNPEGRNMPGFSYKYACPVGGLFGGLTPGAENSWAPSTLSWEDYHISETCLDASALLLSALTIVSNGGSDYYEKKCDNCKSGEESPFSGETYAAAYHYTFSDVDMFNIQISNESMDDLDSVVAYIYFDATIEDVESCGVVFDEDLCQVYDIAGFNKPCDNDRDMMDFLRHNGPQRIEETYNEAKKTYTWVQAISIGKIGFGNRLRFDLGVYSGLSSAGMCETLRTPAKVKVTEGWSFTAHTATKDAPAYAGTPDWDKDQGDIQQAPEDPYIVIRSKGKLLWGYGPGKTTDDRVGVVKMATTAKARMQVVKNNLYVLATAQGTKTVKIFDMLGNQLMAQTFDGTRTEVNLARLPHRGALIARVMQNDKVLATQSIKVK